MPSIIFPALYIFIHAYSNRDIFINKIIEQALHAVISGPDLSPKAKFSTQPLLLSRVAAVHVVFYENHRELLLFGQLNSHMPGTLIKLQGRNHSEKRLDIHIHAVAVAIKDSLMPPLTSSDRNYLPQWLMRMQLSQNVIDSILTMEQNVDPFAIRFIKILAAFML